MDTKYDKAFEAFCAEDGIKPDGQFANDIRPAFDFGVSVGLANAAPGRVSVDAEALRRILTALVSAPHLVREFQATREPVALFADNPINVLLRNYQEANL